MTDVTEPIPYRRDGLGRFVKGTAGKQPGMRARLSKRAFRQISDNLDLIVAALLAKAMSGDTDAARILLAQVLPKDQPIELDELSADAVANALMNGEITPNEGKTLSATLEKLRNVQDIDELRVKIDELEKHLIKRN